MNPNNDVIKWVSGFPPLLQRVVSFRGCSGKEQSKERVFSPFPKLTLFLFLLLSCIVLFSWSSVKKKKILCSHEPLKTGDWDQNSLFPTNTTWEPMTNIFWNSVRLYWPSLTSTPVILPEDQNILAKPCWLLVLPCFLNFFNSQNMFFLRNYTGMEWVLSLLFLKIKATLNNWQNFRNCHSPPPHKSLQMINFGPWIGFTFVLCIRL